MSKNVPEASENTRMSYSYDTPVTSCDAGGYDADGYYNYSTNIWPEKVTPLAVNAAAGHHSSDIENRHLTVLSTRNQNAIGGSRYSESTAPELQQMKEILAAIMRVEDVTKSVEFKMNKMQDDINEINIKIRDIWDKIGDTPNDQSPSPQNIGLPLSTMDDFIAFNADDGKVLGLRQYLVENAIGTTNIQKVLREFLNIVAPDEFYFNNIVWCQKRNETSNKATLINSSISIRAFYGALKMSKTYKKITRIEYEAAAQIAVKNAYQRHYMVQHSKKNSVQDKHNKKVEQEDLVQRYNNALQ